MRTEGTLYLTYVTRLEEIIMKSKTLGGMLLEAKDIVEERKNDKRLLEARFLYAAILPPVPQYAKNYSSMDFVLYDCIEEKKINNK